GVLLCPGFSACPPPVPAHRPELPKDKAPRPRQIFFNRTRGGALVSMTSFLTSQSGCGRLPTTVVGISTFIAIPFRVSSTPLGGRCSRLGFTSQARRHRSG